MVTIVYKSIRTLTAQRNAFNSAKVDETFQPRFLTFLSGYKLHNIFCDILLSITGMYIVII